MLKFSRFYFEVRFCGITNKRLSEWWKLISNICSTVCIFQSMKNLVELNSLFSTYFCYITWLDSTVDDLQTRPLLKSYCFEEITNWVTSFWKKQRDHFPWHKKPTLTVLNLSSQRTSSLNLKLIWDWFNFWNCLKSKLSQLQLPTSEWWE